ncbi:MAG TPA: sulfotransferase [Acidobacteriota bacterium]
MKETIKKQIFTVPGCMALYRTGGRAKFFFTRLAAKTLAHLRWLAKRRELGVSLPPLIIGGSGGSGTRVFLEIACRGGLFMGEQNRTNSRDSEPFAQNFVKKWRFKYLLAGGRPSEPEVRRMRRDLDKALVNHRRGIPSRDTAWGLKFPFSIFFLPFLNEQLPGMRYLHVIRDGRDMAFSPRQRALVRIGHIFLRDQWPRLERQPQPVQSMALWSRINLQAARYGREAMGERYLRVRFEDLCADPRAVISRIFNFIGAPEPNLDNACAEVASPPTIGRWRRQDPELIPLLLEEGREALKTFGYGEETRG